MPCDMERITKPALAKQGWSDAEIELLEKEIELAKQKAKADSFAKKETLIDQKRAMVEAEQRARKIAHDRFHAKEQEFWEQLQELGDAKALPVGLRAIHGHVKE